MKFTDGMLDSYAQPLSPTEDRQCKNAIGMVRDALKVFSFTDDNKAITPLYSDTLSYSIEMRSISGSRKIKIFVQGSYANNTNVRTESDVDIAVVEESTFRPEYRPLGQSHSIYGFTVPPTPTIKFKDEVEEALKAKFGADVKRGDKSIKVRGNTYRKDTDSVPCRRYRDYRNDYLNDVDNYLGGIIIYPDSGGQIINYPEQHIYNGRQKNITTHAYFKKMVRVIKKIRNIMEDNHISSACNVGSFVLESMLWNVPDSWYLDNCEKYRKVFAFNLLIDHLKANKIFFTSWKEANGIKNLCPEQDSYSKLCKFLDDLSEFYEFV
jgi:hypothetical protein